MMDRVTASPIDLNQAPTPLDYVQPMRKCPRERPPTSTIQARALFDEMLAPTSAESVWSILLVLRSFPMDEGDNSPKLCLGVL
jgi:hypothetical protein